MQEAVTNNAVKNAVPAARQGVIENASNRLPLQAKLTVGAADDYYEREADSVADKVMRMPATSFVQRKCAECEKEEKEKIHRKPLSASITPLIQAKAAGTATPGSEEDKEDFIQRKCAKCEEEDRHAVQRKPVNGNSTGFIGAKQHGKRPVVAPQVAGQIQSTRGNGNRMDAETSSFMSRRIGADFSGVNIHNDAAAASLSTQLNAKAFTVGVDIYFNRGMYDPSSAEGKHLLAHELTHVVQQGGGKQVNEAGNDKAGNRFRPGVTTKSLPADSAAAGEKTQANKPGTIQVKQTTAPAATNRNAAATTKAGTPGTPVKKEGNTAEKEVPHAPKKPGQDPAFRQVRAHLQHEAVKQKTHDDASVKKTETVDASAMEPAEQRDESAQVMNASAMQSVAAEQEKKKFSAEKFKADLRAKINAKQPESEGEAKAFAEKPPLEHFEQNFSGEVAKEQGNITGQLEKQAIPKPTGGVVDKQAIPIPDPKKPPPVKPANAGQAIPKPRTDEEISQQRQSDRLDDAMEDNKLSDDQLAESREPSFIETLHKKQEAKQKAAEAPAVYREEEKTVLEGAEAAGGDTMRSMLHGMSAINKKSGGSVFGGQQATETQTEKRQRQIRERIDCIYNETVTDVKAILDGMASKVKEDFANTLKVQTDTFNENLRSQISDYYGNFRIDDELFGPDDVVVLPDGSTRAMTLQERFGAVEAKTINPDVYRIFINQKNWFLMEMDDALDDIAASVENGLTAAHNRITQGRQEIACFKATLSGNELDYASQLEEEVQMKFESLEQSINDTRDDLLQTLADDYTANVNQLEKSFNEINDELKKSWIDRAIEFIKTVGKTIYQLADLLLSILVRVAYLVWDIIKHPIRFFETLVTGLKDGISRFVGNIGTYLQEAFWTWITGATPVKNIQISVNSGVRALFDLVLQVLNLGPQELRTIVEKVLGREFLEVIDKGIELGEKLLEPVTILFTKGPGALWEHIKDSLQSIIQASFDRIKETVFFAFVEKGLKYIAGFFVPGGGFVKIVKAIVSAFQFVAENLENIRHFFDSVFDSMEAAVAGQTEGVANKIVNGLKTGVVMALDFLAKLLGIDKIVDSVHKIIQAIRKPIVAAIEWLLNKAKPLVMQLMKGGKKLWEKGKAGFEAGKEKLGQGVRKIAGTDGTPQERLDNALVEGQKAVNKYAGRKVGMVVLTPLLTGIRLKYGLKKLRVEPAGETWELYGEINPSKKVPTQVQVAQAGAGTQDQQALESLVSLEKVTYSVDSLGRAHGSKGHIKAVKDSEDREDIPALLPKGYLPGDHRGHLIGDRFYGSGINANIVPMHRTLNLSTFKVFENKLAKEFKASKAKGEAVLLHMNIVPKYPGSDASIAAHFRPTHVDATAKILRLKAGTGKPEADETLLEKGPLENPMPVLSAININTAPDSAVIDLFGAELGGIINGLRKNKFESMLSLRERVSQRAFHTQIERYDSAILSKAHLINFR